MELNLRKARKLETKIRGVIDAADLRPSTKVRALATPEERSKALEHARADFLGANLLLTRLIKARFSIRRAIAKANADTGINDLMGKREEVQSLLAKNQSGVEVLDMKEAEDMASARRSALEGGGQRGYGGESSVTLALPVATAEDVASFKRTESDLKKQLENIEDELSQKNVGVKITLDSETASLLQTVGLL